MFSLSTWASLTNVTHTIAKILCLIGADDTNIAPVGLFSEAGAHPSTCQRGSDFYVLILSETLPIVCVNTNKLNHIRFMHGC